MGIISDVCKYDGGVLVWIPTERAKYICVNTEREGDSITILTKGP